MSYFVRFLERIFWGIIGLGIMLIIFWAVIHILRNQGAGIPGVGGPVSAGASWVGSHAQSY